MLTCTQDRRRCSWVALCLLCPLLVLAVLLAGTTREAAAAVAAPGLQVYTWTYPGWNVSLTCENEGCYTGTSTVSQAAGTADSAELDLVLSASDPRELGCWPVCTPAQYAALGSHQNMTKQSGTAWTWTGPALRADDSARFVWTFARVPSSMQITAIALWDLGVWAPPPEPEPTDPPTDPTDPTDPADPTQEPTDPGTGTGGSISCTEAQPCPVTVVGGLTVDASGMTVEALTPEQWAFIQAAAGTVIFFSAAGFAYSWRRGGSR